MKKKSRIGLYSALPLLVTSSLSSAVQFDWSGPGSMALDNTISYGVLSRVSAQDEDNDGINSNDGNRNFKEGIVSQVVSLRTEMDLNFGDYGFFARGSAHKDVEMTGSTNYGEEDFHDSQPSQVGSDGGTDNRFTDDAKDTVGHNAELLDAYFYGFMDIGDYTVSGKLGRHIISWGESLFYRNAIGDFNAVDAGKLRLPGVGIKEAILPSAAFSFNTSLSDSIDVEGFYMFEFRETRLPPVSSFFSTGDLFAPGGNTAYKTTGAGIATFLPLQQQLEAGGVLTTTYAQNDAYQVASVEDEILASDAGQFGLSMRFRSEALNDTEFGVYFSNYHSKNPIINASIGDFKLTGQDVQTIQAAATTAATQLAQAGLIAPADVPTTVQQAIGAMGAFELGANSEVHRKYLEDIQVLGLSFNTMLGDTVFGGEMAYRPDMPIAISSSDDLSKDLIKQVASLVPALGGDGILNLGGETYDTNTQDSFDNVAERGVFNLAINATSNLNSGFFSDQLVSVVELASEHITGDDLTYLAYDGVTRDFVSKAGCSSFSDCAADGKITENAWGYSLALVSKWNGVFTGTQLKGMLRFKHDVNGNSHRTGNFVEGKKALTVGVDAKIYNTLNMGLKYTDFYDGTNNKLRDRDNVALNMSYSF